MACGRDIRRFLKFSILCRRLPPTGEPFELRHRGTDHAQRYGHRRGALSETHFLARPPGQALGSGVPLLMRTAVGALTVACPSTMIPSIHFGDSGNSSNSCSHRVLRPSRSIWAPPYQRPAKSLTEPFYTRLPAVRDSCSQPDRARWHTPRTTTGNYADTLNSVSRGKTEASTANAASRLSTHETTGFTPRARYHPSGQHAKNGSLGTTRHPDSSDNTTLRNSIWPIGRYWRTLVLRIDTS